MPGLNEDTAKTHLLYMSQHDRPGGMGDEGGVWNVCKGSWEVDIGFHNVGAFHHAFLKLNRGLGTVV